MKNDFSHGVILTYIHQLNCTGDKIIGLHFRKWCRKKLRMMDYALVGERRIS